MPRKIDAATLKGWLHDEAEIALLDVREHGQFGEGHLFYAVPLPYSRLELDLGRLVPRPAARLVLYDDGTGDVAQRAARRAAALGYTAIHVLEGGTRAWRDAGYRLFRGVNVVSKTFGEIVEHAFDTPSISADELQARRQRGDDIVVIDGRPVDEYRKMNIPGSICCPNGELAYRIGDLVPRATTTIVVNCAGRTRSIIGAQTLRGFGIENPVLALRNGTMGWRLAGLALEHGSNRLYPDAPSAARLAALRGRAEAFARRRNVRRLGAAEAAAWLGDAGRTTHVLDIRTREEFDGGHLAGAVHAPGGQLIQATDQWLGVHKGRVLLVDDTEVRAIVVAAWLKLMGWEVAVLAGGREGWATLATAMPPAHGAGGALPQVAAISAAALAGRLGRRPAPLVLDLRASADYRSGHIAGARWAIRPLAAAAIADMAANTPIVLVAAEPDVGRAFAADLLELGHRETLLLSGAPHDWQAAGLAIEATPDRPADADCIDYLFFVHDRHAGNLASARQYLAWETGLLDQLDERERAAFRLSEMR